MEGDNCIAVYAMQWNQLYQDGGRVDRPKGTWRRTIEEESRRLGKAEAHFGQPGATLRS